MDAYREELKITVRFAKHGMDNPFTNCEKYHYRSWAKVWEHVREIIEFDSIRCHRDYTDSKPVVVHCINHLTDESYNKREGWWFVDVYNDEAKEYKIENQLDFLKESTIKRFQAVVGMEKENG